MKTAEEIIIEKVGEYWWICGKHRPEFLAAMEEYAEQVKNCNIPRDSNSLLHERDKNPNYNPDGWHGETGRNED